MADAGNGVPKSVAVLLVAGTVLTMSMMSGHDDTRGPLWHAMWVASLIVLLATGFGAAARRVGKVAGTIGTGAAAERDAGRAERGGETLAREDLRQ